MKRVAFKPQAYVLLGLLCALFFWRIWTPNPIDRASFARGDFSGQFYPFARYQADRLWSGQLPLWNPYGSTGQPFWADVQSAALYPPRWLTIALSGPGGFSYFALELEAIAHIFLAGVFTFAFARRLLADRLAALTSAIVFAFGGYLTSYPILQLAILETIAWLPLILLLIDRALADASARGRNVATIGAGLAWGVSLLAGHPQTAMHVIYFALIYGAWRAHTRAVNGRVALGRLLACVAIGLGASAGQWLPSLEFMQQSTRTQFGYDALSGGFPLRDAVQVLLPGTTSAWSPLYVGVLPLALAALSGFGARRQEMRLWRGVAVGAFVLSLGGATFLYSLLYQWVPGFELFRSQERLAGLYSFALAIAAGGGLAAWRSSETGAPLGRTRRALNWVALGLAVLSAALFFFWQISDAPAAARALDRSVFALLLVVLATGLLGLRPSTFGWRAVWPLLVIGLIAFDLFTINWQTNLEQRRPEAQTALPAFLDVVRADAEPVRVDGRGLLGGNWGNLADIQTVDGISPLVIRGYARVRDALTKEREWALFNVKYVASTDSSLSVPAERVASENWQGRALNLFRLANVTPRAWVVHRARVLDDDSALSALADPGFDFLSEAIVREPVSVSQANRSSSARIMRYEAERIEIDVDASAAGLLVLSELDYPGWRATLDGAEAPIVRADVALRAVAVPAGRHRVELSFQPVSAIIGLIVSVAIWAISSIVGAWLTWRRSSVPVT